MSHGATPQTTETANLQGGAWQFVDKSPDVSGLMLMNGQKDNKEQVAYTATFDDMTPVAVKVSQLTTNAQHLYVYANPTVVNGTGKEWTGMQTSLVSSNHVAADGVHPPFAHFHEKEPATPNWTTPTLGPFSVIGGGNSTKGVVPGGPHGLTGADELYANGTLGAGETAQFQNLGIHQFPYSVNQGQAQGGEFYIVHTPNHLPIHTSLTYAMPSLQSVTEGDGNDNGLTGNANNNLLFGYGGNDGLFGGLGRDVLAGGTGFDLLKGEEGDDWLFGGTNEDTLVGGKGKDLLDGGAGKDVASYEGEEAAVTVNLSGPMTAGFVTAKVGGVDEDILVNIEDIWGGLGDDALTGDAKDNFLKGGIGADTLSGGDGNDRLQGDPGKDVLNGGFGTDYAVFSDNLSAYEIKTTGTETTVSYKSDAGNVDVLSGVEFLSFADQTIATPKDPSANAPFVPDPNPPTKAPPGANMINGTAGNDPSLTGTGNADDILAGGGNDTVDGKGGDDFVSGGDGNDVIQGGTGYDLIRGGQGQDKIHGGAGADIIYADSGNDQVWGDGGADQLWGGLGADTLNGGDDDDLIVGEKGDDLLNGGAGVDVFGFWPGDGKDTVTGFETGDSLVFKNLTAADVAVTMSASNTVFTWATGSVTVNATSGMAEGTDYFFVG
ncbi:calcium-binding protein [Azospirillum brasilense]|uniref:calcium-binding protein n=1 Tax=Azospirillum brasilense TaxID=192 RepID=UPI001EDC1249|nr:calcium-binding protein [Azospirillum brasilense]UKJ72504.1 calcium-binding protein [Azospirillum brasilense]